MVNGGVVKAWSVRQEEFMIPELYLSLTMSCFNVYVISICTLSNLHFVCVYVCVFYNPLGVSLCHQIRDPDQHAFEAGRTSVKLIVPLHLRPALFFWGNNLSVGIQGRVWKEEGIAMILCSWKILWSSSDFLLWIWADAPVPAQVAECFMGGGMQHQSKCNYFRQPLTLAHSFSLVSAQTRTHRHTCSNGLVTWWQKTELISTRWCLWVLPFHFFSPHLLVFPPPLLSSSPESHVGCNYKHGFGESVVLFKKRWHCKTFVLLNMF